MMVKLFFITMIVIKFCLKQS